MLVGVTEVQRWPLPIFAPPTPADAPVTIATRPAWELNAAGPRLLARNGLDGFLGDRDHPVELLLGDDEGRRKEDVLHSRARDHTALAPLLHASRAHLPVRPVGLLR